MGTNGLAGRLGKLEASARRLPEPARAELEAFLKELSGQQLQGFIDCCRAVRQGTSTGGSSPQLAERIPEAERGPGPCGRLEHLLGAERCSELAALLRV